MHDIYPKITFGPSWGQAGAAIALHWSAGQNHWAAFLTETRLKSKLATQGATEPSLGNNSTQIHQSAQNTYFFIINNGEGWGKS